MSKFNYRIIFIISIFVILNISNIYSQKHDISFEDGVIYLSQYIASDNFIKMNESLNDLELVDTIYVKAIKFYEGDISEALLALTFATLPFNEMPIRLPIINLRIPLKLPSVNKELFLQKRDNLPGIVFFDSRKNGGQDKDKVAHFFGNAFLSYNLSLINASNFFGLFVELFESAFKVSGGVDFRDLQTNYLGNNFGDSLRNNPNLFPSDFFNIYSLFYFSYN